MTDDTIAEWLQHFDRLCTAADVTPCARTYAMAWRCYRNGLTAAEAVVEIFYEPEEIEEG